MGKYYAGETMQKASLSRITLFISLNMNSRSLRGSPNQVLCYSRARSDGEQGYRLGMTKTESLYLSRRRFGDRQLSSLVNLLSMELCKY